MAAAGAAAADSGIPAGITGLVSILVGTSRGLRGRLLHLVGITSLAVAARIGINYPIEIPLGPETWTALGLALLLFVDLLVCLGAFAYIRPANSPWDAKAILLAALLSASMVLVPTGWVLAVAVRAYAGLGVVAVYLLVRLALAVRRRRDVIGASLLCAFATASAAGLHDLALHLSWIDSASGPLQMLVTPVLVMPVVLMALVPIGTMNSRLGSRLVALSFRVRKASSDPLLARSIEDLIAVANAVRHARPSRITISARPGSNGEAAELRVEDDGIGHFRLPSTGGLGNMRKRARSAGLALRFEGGDGVKRVCVGFPAGCAERR